MTFNGYLSLGGNEILNSSRVAQYSGALGITAITCQGCEMLPRALGDEPYTSPDQDDAPWWDPSVVESKDFAGVLGVEITGLDRPVNSREVVPLAGDGAALSPVRRKPREILVRAYLFARTECAMSYGRSWLAAAVRGGACGLPCVGDDLCYLACCPAPCPPPGPGIDDDLCGNKEWRTLYNVGVLAGPTPRAVTRISGGFMQEVEFTLTAGNPFIYRLPVLVTTGPNPDQAIPSTQSEDDVDCGEDVGCVQQALTNCPPLPPPLLPIVPPDPCFPQGEFYNYRAAVSVPRDITPLWLETVPYIRFRAGTEKLERLTIRWYSNPQEVNCKAALQDPDPSLRPLGPCDTCAEVNIPVIPAGATLTFDGRLQRAWVDCPGGPGLETAEPPIYGRNGTAFQWPVFGCGQSLCLEIIMRRPKPANPPPVPPPPPQARWEIYTVAREDAS